MAGKAFHCASCGDEYQVTDSTRDIVKALGYFQCPSCLIATQKKADESEEGTEGGEESGEESSEEETSGKDA